MAGSKRGKSSSSHPAAPLNQPTATQGSTVQPQTYVQALQYQYHSPIPPPEILAQYNAVVPDAANRILRMAENQSDHRMQLERYNLLSESKRSWWGLASGFVIVMTGIVGAVLLGLHGNEVAASVLGVGDLGTAAGIFVYGTRVRSSERTERIQMMTGRGQENTKANS